MIRRPVIILFLFACLTVAVPAPTSAQVVGIGPRVSFVRGDLLTGTPSTRLVGATVRMRSSAHMGLELSLDYRTAHNEAMTSRLRETPVQASLLLFPVRARFAPYLLGGIGVYTQVLDTLDANRVITESTRERKLGWHLGIGAEMRVSRRSAFFVDYRFRFVTFGPTPAGSEPITIPGATLIPGLDKLKLSHQGSMWTSGIAFYF